MARKDDPFGDLHRLNREVDRMFLELCGLARLSRPKPSPFHPPADVYYAENLGKVFVKLEIAGVTMDALTIELHERTLVIEGVRDETDRVSGRVYQQMEIEYGPFQRQVLLPADVRLDGSTAHYENGFLVIELPLSTRTVKRIPISREDQED